MKDEELSSMGKQSRRRKLRRQQREGFSVLEISPNGIARMVDSGTLSPDIVENMPSISLDKLREITKELENQTYFIRQGN
jgi:hypothetical protein